MKSIHNTRTKEFTLSDEIINHLEKEGYEFGKCHSYNENIQFFNGKGYSVMAGRDGLNYLYVYIGSNGIAIDSDYDCGGNSCNYFFPYTNSNDFEQAYDEMVEQLIKMRD